VTHEELISIRKAAKMLGLSIPYTQWLICREASRSNEGLWGTEEDGRWELGYSDRNRGDR